MDNNSIKNNDPLQLQQMIIFLKSELVRYKNEVNRLRDSDYYSLVLRLERENVQLTKRKKELSKELFKLKREFEKETSYYNENIQAKEIQKKKLILSVEALLKDKNDLRLRNNQLTEALYVAQEELATFKKEYREVDFKASIENLENKLINSMQETSKQLVMDLEKTLKEFNKSDNINKYLVKDLDGKNVEIEKLLNEITNLREQSKDSVIAHLDPQAKNVLAQSIDFDEQLDEKLRILDDLEEKLNQLTLEIDGQ